MSTVRRVVGQILLLQVADLQILPHSQRDSVCHTLMHLQT